MKVIGVLLFVVFQLSSSLRVSETPGTTVEKEFQTPDGPVTLIVSRKQGRALNFDTPKSFEVTSKLLQVNSNDAAPSKRRGRQLETVSIDEEGIPVVEGVREPDDPNDTKIYRNARVINNILVTDEDNVRNEVNDNNKFSRRQGRIMTGPVTYVKKDTPSAASSFYNTHYQPDRSGLADSSSQASSQGKTEEKIVSYSYSTFGKKEEKKKLPSKDVVYGSGFASEPPKESQAKRASFGLPSFAFPPTPNPSSVSFQQPKITWSDFHSSPDTSSSQNNPWSHPSPSSSQFTFPSSSSVSKHTSSQFGTSSISGAQNLNNNVGNIPQTYAQQGQDFNTWVSNIERKPKPQQNQYIYTQQHFNSPPVHTNQVRRNHQPSIPTPHQAFGQAGESLIHPNIIPVDSQNFVIQEATFQNRPGAPKFSLPVPRPVSQVHHQLQPQNYQTHQYYPQSNQYYSEQPYYYQDYIEELDNRPLIDKMIDPLRRVGEKVKEKVIVPVLDAGQRLGDRFRIPERVDKIANGNVDADALPLVGGAVAVATLGALGAYAASKYSFNDFRNLLPTAATRSTKSNANVQDILLKLANDLENEDPSFIERFTSSTSWLESSCAQRIFCTLVTTTMREEEEKLQKENVRKEFEKRLQNDGEVDPATSRDMPESRVARRFLEREVGYLETQMNNLVNSLKVDISGGKNKSLKKAARDVVEAVKNKNCSSFTCTSKH